MAFAQAFQTILNAPNTQDYYASLISPDGKWFACTELGLYKSLDSGASWTQLGAEAEWNDICASSDGTILYAVRGYNSGGVNYGAVYKSTDSGASFSKIASTDGNRLTSIACDSTGALVIAVDFGNSRLLRSTDSGANWSPIASGIARTSICCSSNGAKWIAGVNSPNNFVSVSTDSGATWSTSAVSTRWLATCISGDGSTMYAARFNGQIYKSVDDGANWTTHGDSLPWGSIGCTDDGSNVIATSGYDIYVSEDSASTFSKNYTSDYDIICNITNSISTDEQDVFIGTSSVFGTENFPLKAYEFYLTSIDPNLGSVDGGTPVTLTGAGFNTSTTAAIDGNDLTDVTVVDSTTLIGITPAGTLGSKDVTVTNP